MTITLTTMGFVALGIVMLVLSLAFIAWRRYYWASEQGPHTAEDTCEYSIAEAFPDDGVINVPHQKGVRWLTDVFSRSVARYPNLTALQVPHTGETLTFAELDARAERIARALAPFVNGPDQVVAVAMSQDNADIVACHLGILKAGGTLMFLDTTLPDALITHMLYDAQPVAILTRGLEAFRDLPTVDVTSLPERLPARRQPTWLDDPTQRLATIFYTSGTTGKPKGVECHHAGYVNLALSYADYFNLVPGMDATSLTSSLGYDGSISEMYSAWVSGCAVVLLTKEQVRSGPDLVPVLRDAEVTVLFCPPVLLTTLTANPEIDLPYPICRYIVPAGEAFPDALVEPWTRARRQIINTYGPTEASTDTSRQSLRPGEPVTIGTPLANVTYVILAEGELRPLPQGETGELCIGGVHVGRGYRNLPEQTAQRFIEHPEFGRLYRTGDKCQIDPRTRRVHFYGRIDAQLKVRGHRVEAQAVEDILHNQFPEIEAAVLDYQQEALVAFVTAPSVAEGDISVVAPAPADWAANVTAKLAKQLPEPSVPTSIFLVESFTLKPVSGKIDRACLPDLSGLLSEADHSLSANVATGHRDNEQVAVAEDVEPANEELLEICREVLGARLGWDDGFADSGGHSILIARLAQRLQAAGWMVTVRSLLTDSDTVRKLSQNAQRMENVFEANGKAPEETKARALRDEAAAEVLSVGYFTTLQVLFSALMYAPGIAAFLVIFGFLEIGTFFTTASLWAFVVVGFGIYLAGLIVPFAMLMWAMFVKLLLGGSIYHNNVTPGVYPKWSRMHLRIWCIRRIEKTVLQPLGAMYRSPPLMAFALRQLGAKVGDNLQCATDANLAGPLDLLTIDDNVAIQTGSYVQTSRWSGPNLHVGPIHLESDCKIGMRAAVTNDVTVGQGSWVTPFTPIIASIGPNGIWEEAPARQTGRLTRLKRTADACAYSLPIWLLETLNILMQIGLTLVLSIIPTAAILWFARGLIPAGEAQISGSYFSSLLPGQETAAPAVNYFAVTPLHEIAWHLGMYAFITAWLTIVITSVIGCLFIRFTAVKPGLYPSRGLRGALLLYRMKMLNGIQVIWTWTITGQYLRALAGLKFPRLGASECDVMFNLVPEAARADSQVFWAQGSFTNMLDYGSEHITLRPLIMPRNFFSGNNCVAEYGQLPANFLLGVSTPANGIQFRQQLRTRDDEPISVAGNPAVKFANPPASEDNEKHRMPGFGLFLTRVLLNDLFSIGLLRVMEGFVFTMLYVCALRMGLNPFVGAIGSLILAEVSLILLCVGVKLSLVGNTWGIDHRTPFWSWKHFAYFFAQDCFFIWCRGPLSAFAGMILANPILRWMGCGVGHRTLVSEPLQCSDWNAVHFGKDCVIDGFLQLHSFENMELKVKRTHIRDGGTVAVGATVMGGAVIEKDTTLMPLSMVLKEMNLIPAVYEGSPAEPTGPVVAASVPKIALLRPGQEPLELPAAGNVATAQITG
ncbi:MAG: AMP-binding protein [Pseudomonadota bacterium]